MKRRLPLYKSDYLLEFLSRHPECARILEDGFLAEDYLSQVAHMKRFLEYYTSDKTIQQAIEDGDLSGMQPYAERFDPEEYHLLWDSKRARIHVKEQGETAPVSVQRYRSFTREKKTHRQQLQQESCVPVNPTIRRWRERQLMRCYTHLGGSRSMAMVHPPLAFELSKGCSVGCWFCGFSADSKEGDYLYTPENRTEWREILHLFHDVLGPSASTGVCYWATDPLDNPDYEKFCIDYAHILGRFPQTTTAQAHKHIERVRKLLTLSRSLGGVIDRFSILSKGILDKIHTAFSPEELLFTELIMQNMESNQFYSNAGRAAESSLFAKKAEKLNIESTESKGTIACLSGFLLNMLDRSIKLISPCLASDAHPEGYWCFAESTFSNAEHLREIINQMIEQQMPTTLSGSDVLSFREDITFEKGEDGIVLSTPLVTTTLRGYTNIQRIGELVNQGTHTARDITMKLDEETDSDPTLSFHTMNELFNQGFINEDPLMFRPAESFV